MSIKETIESIDVLDSKWQERARERLDRFAVPKGSLGRLPALGQQLAAIQKTLKPSFPQKDILVIAADHGICAEGVSCFETKVTVEMIANFLRGGAGINAFAANANANVHIVDIGVAADLPRQGLISRKINYGTKNFRNEPAMSRKEAIQSIETGIDLVCDMVNGGTQLIATGDMGIGNTTASTAVYTVLSGDDPLHAVGPGTGIDDEGVRRKGILIADSIAKHRPNPEDPIDVLAKVGGFEIGGIAGLILGAAQCQIPVIIDGFISSAGAMVAYALCPQCLDYVVAGHRSHEQGHQKMLTYLGLVPLLSLDLRLGEGTGAALAMPLIDAACHMMDSMLTFEEAAVTPAV